MCQDVGGSESDPVNPTNTFYTDETKATTWAKFINVADPLEIKWAYYSPDGYYNEFTHTSDDPEDEGYEWYDWVKAWGWININGNQAQYKCGDWYVDVFVKDAFGNYEKKYTDFFRILEHPTEHPSVSVTMEPSSPIETQEITLHVSTSDNNHLQKTVLHWNDGSAHTKIWDNINASSLNSPYSIGSDFAGGQQMEYWAEAWDESGNQAEGEHRTTIVAPEIVSVPNRPSGAVYRRVSETGTYITGGSTTNLDHPVQYQFDWGDEQQSPWGAATQSYSWGDEGSYFVRAQARCQTHASRVSDPSNAFMVTVDSSSPIVEIVTNDGDGFSVDQSLLILKGTAREPESASGLASR